MVRFPSLKTFFKENINAMIFMTIASLVMSWFIWHRCCKQVDTLLWISLLTLSIWYALWLGNAYVSQVLDNLYSWHAEPVKRLLVGLAGMTVYTVGAVVTILYFFHFAFGFDVDGQLEDTFYSTIIITLIITMFMTGRAFLINWKQAAVDAERLKKESVEAHYTSLRNQVNPHFLFNSLNALTNLVYQNQDDAVRFIKQLSEVYRYVLDTRDKEVVAVQEEVKFLQSYLYLQQIRFGNKLKLEMRLTDMTGSVAPLALQMLVENAIKHNEISEEKPLTIRVYADADYLVVENNLQRKLVLGEETSGLGLDNIRRRYEFLTHKKLQIVDGPRTFSVRLPILDNR